MIESVVGSRRGALSGVLESQKLPSPMLTRSPMWKGLFSTGLPLLTKGREKTGREKAK